MIVAVSLALVANLLRSDKIPLFEGDTAEKKMPFREISINDAIEKYKTEGTMLVDSRSLPEYLAGHIKGAVNFPETEFDEWIEDFFYQTDPDVTIITYCNGVDCDLAKELAEKLYYAGFENVYYISDGLSRWNAKCKPAALSDE